MATWEKIIVWLVIIVVFTFIFILRRSEDSSLDECSRIAVADPIEISGSFRRGFTCLTNMSIREIIIQVATV